MVAVAEVWISSSDAKLLRALVADGHGIDADQSALGLSEKLAEARIVAPGDLPDDSVRLGSTVTYEELPARAQRRVTLVAPGQADASAGRISVLSPIGRALLGHPSGRVVDVELPMGRQLSVQVGRVESPQAQPTRDAVCAEEAC